MSLLTGYQDSHNLNTLWSTPALLYRTFYSKCSQLTYAPLMRHCIPWCQKMHLSWKLETWDYFLLIVNMVSYPCYSNDAELSADTMILTV